MFLTSIAIHIIVLFSTTVESEVRHTSKGKLYPILNEYVKELYREFRDIPEERRFRLNEIVDYVQNQRMLNKNPQLLFISSNQASIGQMIQIWAETAAYYYGLTGIKTYSGGMNPQGISTSTIVSLERAGFIVYRSNIEGVDLYKVKYSYNLRPIQIFPKKIDYRINPRADYMAIMVERSADINISRVRGTHDRLSLPYNDPLQYEDSAMEDGAYDHLCRQIALEMFYVFSQLKNT